MHTLETKLGYVFHRPELLENALYHSSYANEHRGAGISSNERLEFLGDAVLGFVTAEYLYTKHPDMPEGDLTRIRAASGCRLERYSLRHHRTSRTGKATWLGTARRNGIESDQPPQRGCYSLRNLGQDCQL